MKSSWFTLKNKGFVFLGLHTADSHAFISSGGGAITTLLGRFFFQGEVPKRDVSLYTHELY